MPRVQQTFTNELPEEVEIWVEPYCWCWLLAPGEKLTVDFDGEALSPDREPLPISLSFDGQGAARRFMLVLWEDATMDTSFSIDGEPVAADGDLTTFGAERFVGGGQSACLH